MKPIVEVRLGEEELKVLQEGGPQHGPKLAKLLDDELGRFERWMNENLGGGLVPLERMAVKTYLYHKIVGRIDNLERKFVDPLELASGKTA